MSQPERSLWLLKIPPERRWILRNPVSRAIGGLLQVAGLATFLLLLSTILVPVAALLWFLLQGLSLNVEVTKPLVVAGALLFLIGFCRIRFRGEPLISIWMALVTKAMYPFAIAWVEVPEGQYARARRKRVDSGSANVQPLDPAENRWEFFEIRSPGFYLMKPDLEVFFVGTEDDWNHFEPMAQ